MSHHITSSFVRHLRALFQDAASASLTLFKVMVPVIIFVKILQEINAIQYLALPLEPLMRLCGLPGEMGLVWAFGIVVSTYSAIIVYVAMLPTIDPLSVAQVTTLCSMVLVAHALPIECKVSQKCGVSIRSQLLFRMSGALMLGIMLHLLYTTTGTLQHEAVMLWQPEPPATELLPWAIGEIKNLCYILLIVIVLMGSMRILTALRVTEYINALLKPVLQLIGIQQNAATLTVIGLSMGITYGSGLIIHEVKQGTIAKRDVFASITLMGLCHALIEDTLLMMLLGAHLSGILWARLIFSLAFVGILMRFYERDTAPEHT